MLPFDRETSKKTIGLHNIDGITALTAQMEILTKKLDSLTQTMHMVH